MKKVFYFLSILLAATLIFGAISCKNDSVPDEEPEPKPEEQAPAPEENQNIIKDGTYEVALKPISKTGTFVEVGDGKGKITFNLGLLQTNKCKIEGMDDESNGEYYFYGFVIEDPNDKTKAINGIVLSNEILIDKKMNVVVSDSGKKITYDWTKINFIGIDAKIGFNLLDEKGTDKIFIPEIKLDEYVGTWIHEENTLLNYRLVITKDGTGTYDLGKDKDEKEIKGDMTIDASQNGYLLLIKNNDKSNLGTVILGSDKETNKPCLYFTPEENIFGIMKFIKS